MKPRYLSVAEAEFDEAVAWYRLRSRRVPRHFMEEIRVVERLLGAHSRIGKCVEADARSLCVNGFPYSLIYLIEKNRSGCCRPPQSPPWLLDGSSARYPVMAAIETLIWCDRIRPGENAARRDSR